jgi:hypothetical protein
MNGGYSMKHIGITIAVSLVVLVLVSPLLRPKGTVLPPRTITPELREAVKAYRVNMAELAAQADGMYNAGALPLDEVLQSRMRADLAAVEEFALDAPNGRGGAVTRAVVAAFYTGEIHKLESGRGTAGQPEPVASVEAYYRARIELAQRMPEVAGKIAFASARVTWEKERTPENLKKLFDAEINP